MSSDREIEDLRKRYLAWSTPDLLRVVTAAQDYRPEAVQIAREILATRDQTEVGALTETVQTELQHKREAEQQGADEPLNPGLKVMCFVFCGIPGILFASYQHNKGRTKRAREAWKWVLIGWGTRIVIFLLVLL